MSLCNSNIQAFLKVIRYAEGTAGENGYRTLFGGKLFTNLNDHPYLTKEWPGVKLSDKHCIGAGLKPGCITTAAGAFQITKTTWLKVKAKLSLPDFRPDSQDKAALELIKEKGAFEDVLHGRFDTAVGKVKRVWASMPGAGYSQPEKDLATLKRVYEKAGGQTA
jgi:muramidase (phage lysozyme)